MQLRRPAADVVRLGRRAAATAQRGGEALQAVEGVAVHRQRARGEAALDLQVLEMARDVGVARRRSALARRAAIVGRRIGRALTRAGSSRVSAALATSPMRARNSVPMSAV